MRLNSLSPALVASKRPSVSVAVLALVSAKLLVAVTRVKSSQERQSSSRFEGGQMPLQKRLPKYGFTSRVGRVSAEVRLDELNKVAGNEINLQTLLKQM